MMMGFVFWRRALCAAHVLVWCAGAPSVDTSVGRALLGTDGGKRVLRECGPANLTARGREMVADGEIILFKMQTFTQTHMCTGRRQDWRESLPQCFGAMTGLDVFVHHGHDDTCTSCGTLDSVPCGDVFKRSVGMLFVIGGGNMAVFDCGGALVGGSGKKTKEDAAAALALNTGGRCVIDENRTLDMFGGGTRFLQNAHGPRTVKVWLPMVQIGDPNWGLFERGRLFSSSSGGAEWRALNDYHLPKVASPPSAWGAEVPHVDRIAEHPIAREDDLFLYVARLDRGKGQALLLESIAAAPAAYRGARFAFFLDATLTAGDYARNKDQRLETDRVVRALETVPRETLLLYERRVHSRVVKHNITAARGLLHLAEFDRNPRVLYEALDHGTPVMTSVQTQAYRGLECAPAAAALVVDAAAGPTALAGAFEAFSAGSADPAAAARALPAIVDGLRPQAVYPCLCAALGVCGTPAKGAHAAFSAAFDGGKVRVPSTCPLGRRLEGIRCATSDLFTCVRWGTWIEGARLSTGRDGSRCLARAAFRSSAATRKHFGEHFDGSGKSAAYREKSEALGVPSPFGGFDRGSCYNATLRKLFLESALVRPYWQKRSSRPDPSRRGKRAPHP